ncbi:hypothetical protein EK904_000045, partial [Melospiza melodia maxima]
ATQLRQHISAVRQTQEVERWRRLAQQKNQELEKFRMELDSILDVLLNDWRAGPEQAFLVVLTFKLFFVSFSDYSSCAGKTDGRVGLAVFLQGQYRKKTIKYSVSVVIGVPFKREGCIDKVCTMGCSGSDIVSTSLGDLDRLRDQSDVKTVG